MFNIVELFTELYTIILAHLILSVIMPATRSQTRLVTRLARNSHRAIALPRVDNVAMHRLVQDPDRIAQLRYNVFKNRLPDQLDEFVELSDRFNKQIEWIDRQEERLKEARQEAKGIRRQMTKKLAEMQENGLDAHLERRPTPPIDLTNDPEPGSSSEPEVPPLPRRQDTPFPQRVVNPRHPPGLGLRLVVPEFEEGSSSRPLDPRTRPVVVHDPDYNITRGCEECENYGERCSECTYRVFGDL
ncbi:hypothetical protein DFP72DRAFT_855246 [Ephemerocybe angulata]|uniref:Uncharacterized protein n=1 Tax=Ephemerocybe angulata TaxID=980116 RepID=A0A8H6HGC0_9AGAR|nr:hypothetical protein DFP72DRAFT_855246 [Tulosesus angulatus]